MYITLERIYRKTKSAVLLENAVAKGWITEAEKQQIIGMQ